MEYQALARKYRPRTFAELVGQEHVSKTLIHAIENNRLHHAYLFSGTRGVGKTTIARIFAKSLNCEQGVVAQPCGQCAVCREVDEGRFIDLIEVDAASRTRVEDTRELLDNVQYAPVTGRYKVYLIDEVHMLSGHSFNALLKTLEEPPEHVKFLLATTDPQNLPITVLSRCLQFNLRQLTATQIGAQIEYILKQEKIDYEPLAPEPIAQAANGSMRDALSLLDQAIAYANGYLTIQVVDSLLDNIPFDTIFNLLQALFSGQARVLIENLRQILSLGVQAEAVLNELTEALQKLAVLKMIPDLQQQNPRQEKLQTLSSQVSDEDLQLYYQIALSGQQELAVSPSTQGAMEMILLRMLAFTPQQWQAADFVQEKKTADLEVKKKLSDPQNTAHPDNTYKPYEKELADIAPDSTGASEHIETSDSAVTEVADDHNLQFDDLNQQWLEIVQSLDVGGLDRELLYHSGLLEKNRQGQKLLVRIGVDPQQAMLLNDDNKGRLKQYLHDFFLQHEGVAVVSMEVDVADEQSFKDVITPRAYQQHEREQLQQQAEEAIKNDPHIQMLINNFSGKIIEGSIQPIIRQNKQEE